MVSRPVSHPVPVCTCNERIARIAAPRVAATEPWSVRIRYGSRDEPHHMRPSVFVWLLLSLPVTAQDRLLQPADLPARTTAARTLKAVLEVVRDPTGDPGRARWRAALEEARKHLPAGSTARATLDGIAQRPAERAASALAELVADLEFRPVREAELPDGVSGFQALDELELRAYPTYRLVRTKMRGRSTAAFWPLFRHIQSHDIAMTTPVQIDYRSDGAQPREASMAFLYGSRALGATGREGSVEVVDVPATNVITVGSRGLARPDRIAAMRSRLEGWIARSPVWRSAGPMRVMEYNSPFVRGDRRYFEVQIPVARREAKTGKRVKV